MATDRGVLPARAAGLGRAEDRSPRRSQCATPVHHGFEIVSKHCQHVDDFANLSGWFAVLQLAQKAVRHLRELCDIQLC